MNRKQGLLHYVLGSFSSLRTHFYLNICSDSVKSNFLDKIQYYSQQVVQLQLKDGQAAAGWVFFSFYPGSLWSPLRRRHQSPQQRLGYSCPGSATPDTSWPCFPARRVNPMVMFYHIPRRSFQMEGPKVISHSIPWPCLCLTSQVVVPFRIWLRTI